MSTLLLTGNKLTEDLAWPMGSRRLEQSWGHPHITSSSRGGRGVASLMTTDDKGGIDRTDDVIKTVIL